MLESVASGAELPTGRAKAEMVRRMFDTIAPRYDLLNRLMTLGLDRGWRRRAIRMLDLAPGSLVLDLACGTADLARELSRSGQRAVGVDSSGGMLASARAGDARLLLADAGALPFRSGALDGVVSGFALRNLADLPGVLAECARVLRPGGRVALLEVDTPSSPLLETAHRIWMRSVVPRLGAALSDRAAYDYLPRSVAYLPPRAELLELLERSGFRDAAHRPLSGGIAQVVTATRAGGVPLGQRRPAASARQG